MSIQAKVTNQLASNYKHSFTFYKQSTKKRPIGIELTPKAFNYIQARASRHVHTSKSNQPTSIKLQTFTSILFYKQSTKSIQVASN